MISLQPELSPALPPIEGNAEYFELAKLFENIDQLLKRSGLEFSFISRATGRRRLTSKRKKKLRQALRCTLVRSLLNFSYRTCAAELACNHLLQRFCLLIEVDRIKVPSKGQLESFEKMVGPEVIDELINTLNEQASQEGEKVQPLGLEAACDLKVQYVDTTCLKAPIHYPIDWLLFRDATRTLMLAVKRIRNKGLKHRMEEPEVFQNRMNQLCIQMTHTRRKAGGRKERKRVLRKMKKLLRKIGAHSKRHLEVLEQGGCGVGFSAGEKQQLRAQIEGILEQLDGVIKQAHERIIGERQVADKDKILSLYEPDVHVIKRGKAGAEVEFGNTFLLCEGVDGLITHWELFKDRAPADVKLVEPMVKDLKAHRRCDVSELVGDRGFDSQYNKVYLEAEEITNSICPRNPADLADRLTDPVFRSRQTRRAQTEGRIAILFAKFFGRPMRKKGFTNRKRQVAWRVLAHNLWVLARRLAAEELAQAA